MVILWFSLRFMLLHILHGAGVCVCACVIDVFSVESFSGYLRVRKYKWTAGAVV